MRKWVAYFGASLLVPTAAIGALAFHLRGTPILYEFKLLARAIAAPHPRVAVFGDSIVQRTPIGEACGSDAFNAGVGGTTAKDALAFAPLMQAALRPSRVIVAIGINDASRDRHESAASFRDSYRRLLDVFGTSLAGVVEINPVESAKDYGLRYDANFIIPANAFIRAEAARRGIAVVRAPTQVVGLTLDGVHPNRAGTRHWIQRLTQICAPQSGNLS